MPPDLVVAPAPTDSSRRLWTLNWTGNYDTGEHEGLVTFPAASRAPRRTFLTSSEPRVALRKRLRLPDAVRRAARDDQLHARRRPAGDGRVQGLLGLGLARVPRVEPAVSPGYHQWVWDGRDRSPDDIANGTYLYEVIAQDDRGLKSVERGKLARLR